MTANKYKTLYYLTAVFFGVMNATIFWFSLMWFVSGTGMLQMWFGSHLITFVIGFTLSFGISAVQTKHIPEVIFGASQLGSKAVFLIPVSTAFRAISDSLLPSDNLSIGSYQFDSVEVFAVANSIAIVLFVLFTIFSWLAEKSVYAE